MGMDLSYWKYKEGTVISRVAEDMRQRSYYR